MRQIHHSSGAAAVALLLAWGAAAAAEDFQVTSASLAEPGALGREQFFDGAGCGGRNVSPALEWRGAPAETRSFAITIHDETQDRPGILHWVVLDISPKVTGLHAGDGMASSARLPPGAIQARNDFGRSEYRGMCPTIPGRVYRYRVTVWALGTRMVRLHATASRDVVERFLKPHALATAHLLITGQR